MGGSQGLSSCFLSARLLFFDKFEISSELSVSFACLSQFRPLKWNVTSELHIQNHLSQTKQEDVLMDEESDEELEEINEMMEPHV